MYHDDAVYGYSNKKVKKATTYFSRYKDKELLKNRLNGIRAEKSLKESNKKSRDTIKKKISIKQKINVLKKKESSNKITDKEKEKLNQLEEEYKTL